MNWRKSNICQLCGKAAEVVFQMPRFPLTECYEPWAEKFEDRGYYDQAFIYCEPCNHGQLETVIEPKILYGEGYRTKTGSSIGSRVAVNNFSAFIKEYANLLRRQV